MEEAIFRGAYGWREICVIKSVGQACSAKEIYLFFFVLLCIQGQIPNKSPPEWAYIRRGDLMESFFALQFWGAYYFRNFMVSVIFDV